MIKSALFLSLIPTISQAAPWPDVIESVKARAAQLTITAEEIGAPDPGNHSIEAIGAVHECAIIGRMLGQVDAILPLEKLTIAEPSNTMTEDEKLAFAEGVKSLYIWIAVADRLVTLSPSDKDMIWNTKCAGQTFTTDDGGIYAIPEGIILPEAN